MRYVKNKRRLMKRERKGITKTGKEFSSSSRVSISSEHRVLFPLRRSWLIKTWSANVGAKHTVFTTGFAQLSSFPVCVIPFLSLLESVNRLLLITYLIFFSEFTTQ